MTDCHVAALLAMTEKEVIAVATARKRDYLWFITAPGHVQVPVVAPDWEQAPVEAARFWGVPWAKIFCQCELVRKSEVLRNVCIRCKRHFNGEGVECEPCQKLRAIEEKEAQAAARRYWKKHYLREKSQ